jgi:O-antigen/teichoic acid export membrane protein
LTFAFLARAIGVSGFGVFALSWAGVLLANSLQLALIVSPMMSVGPKQDAAVRSIYYGSVTAHELCFILLSFSGAYGGTLGLALCYPSWGIRSLALPLAAATAAYAAQDYGRRYFFTVGRQGLALATDAISYLTQLPLLWWMAERKQLTSAGALWIIGLTSLLGALVSLFWFEELHFDWKMIQTVAARHWKISRWLTPSAVLQWSSLNVLIFSAPAYYGAAAAGALRACQNIVGVAHIWFLGLDNVVPVEAARRLHEGSLDASLRYLWRVLLRWGLVTAAFMLLISAAPSFWLGLVYGARYTQYAYVLRLYGVLYLLIFLAGPFRAGLQAFEYTAPLLWSYVAMAVFAAIVAAPLAKHFGLRGVMFGLIATQFLFQALLTAALILRALRLRSQERCLSLVGSVQQAGG